MVTSKKWRMGNPFDYPENPKEMEQNMRAFFSRIRRMCMVENHIHKWKDICHVLHILRQATENVGLKIDYAYSHGQWFILGFDKDEDYLKLPLVSKEFGRLYRHEGDNFRECTEEEKKIFGIGDSLWEQKMKLKR